MAPMLAITLVSTIVAIIMSIVAWRASRDVRLRSAARVAALAAEIHRLPLSPADPVLVNHPDVALRAQPLAVEADLFASTRRPVGGSRWGFPLVAGVLAVAAAAAVAVIFSGESHTASVSAASPAVRTRSSASAGSARPLQTHALPLELVALGHERDGESLTVRGMILNPSGGAEVSRLIAVVFGFNRDGEFLASGRSPIAADPLLPGTRSSFVVRVPGASDVVRYRVSFRTDDRVVPHADRRTKS